MKKIFLINRLNYVNGKVDITGEETLGAFPSSISRSRVGKNSNYKLFKLDLIKGNDPYCIITHKDGQIDLIANSDVGVETFLQTQKELVRLAIDYNMVNKDMIMTVTY